MPPGKRPPRRGRAPLPREQAPAPREPVHSLREHVIHAFRERVGQPPAVLARAPGRVNLIGEHTDYNEGFVLPMAIDRALWIAAAPRDDGMVLLCSLDFDEVHAFDITRIVRGKPSWIEYVKGVAWALGEAGIELHGWDGVIAGDVPMGAGLSSSAAVELAAARVFVALAGSAWVPATMARICQHAERAWVGTQVGIMDQMISAAGQAGHALLIDCRSLATELVPVPGSVAAVVLDTGMRRELVTSAYNERRAQCESAASALGVAVLRDATMELLEARGGALSSIEHRRARHVISEDQRVLEAAAALRAGDVARMGALMNESHASLRDDFEVSSRELDRMVELARQQPGCLGARLTGAGFGGCAVALVESARAAALAEAVMQGFASTYRAAVAGLASTAPATPAAYVCAAADGASVEIMRQ